MMVEIVHQKNDINIIESIDVKKSGNETNIKEMNITFAILM